MYSSLITNGGSNYDAVINEWRKQKDPVGSCVKTNTAQPPVPTSPPAAGGQASGQRGTCVYSQQDSDGVHCYQGNCTDALKTCSFNNNCSWISGVSTGKRVDYPSQSGGGVGGGTGGSTGGGSANNGCFSLLAEFEQKLENGKVAFYTWVTFESSTAGDVQLLANGQHAAGWNGFGGGRFTYDPNWTHPGWPGNWGPIAIVDPGKSTNASYEGFVRNCNPQSLSLNCTLTANASGIGSVSGNGCVCKNCTAAVAPTLTTAPVKPTVDNGSPTYTCPANGRRYNIGEYVCMASGSSLGNLMECINSSTTTTSPKIGNCNNKGCIVQSSGNDKCKDSEAPVTDASCVNKPDMCISDFTTTPTSSKLSKCINGVYQVTERFVGVADCKKKATVVTDPTDCGKQGKAPCVVRTPVCDPGLDKLIWNGTEICAGLCTASVGVCSNTIMIKGEKLPYRCIYGNDECYNIIEAPIKIDMWECTAFTCESDSIKECLIKAAGDIGARYCAKYFGSRNKYCCWK